MPRGSQGSKEAQAQAQRAAQEAEMTRRLNEELERRVAERTSALLASEERLKRVVQATSDAVWDWDLVTDQIRWNEGVENFRYSVSQVGPDVGWWYERLHPDDRDRVFSSVRALIEGGGQHWADEYRCLRGDGSYAHVYNRGSVIHDASGKPVRMIGAMIDVSERRLAERTLQESGERYRALFEGNGLPMLVYETQTLRLLAVNEAAIRLYGYSRDEFLGMSLKDIRPPEDIPALMKALAPAGSPLGASGVWRHRKKDGTVFEVDLHVSELSYGGRPARVATLRDLSQQRQIEDQLRQVQKMEAVGRLAGGVAHDFNNLLFVMSAYAEQILRRAGHDSPFREKLEGILGAVDRAAALTRQLLTFSRKEPVQTKVVNLNTVVADMDKMLRRLIEEHITVETALADGIGRTRIDPGHVEQVLMNLVVNARDAMPRGGTLAIETANVELDEAYAGTRPGLVPGRFVMLAVSDTGHGMDAATLDHIFEPFFTTKTSDKGTGLGLAIVYGVVQQAGGHISVDSEPGRGTTFKVYLPRTDELEDKATVSPTDPDPRGSETVLLVEDEAGVRSLIRETLEENGYIVLEAHNGRDALRVAAGRMEPVHLLLTDVVLPDMTGPEVADSLTRAREDLRILYVSGYTGGALASLDELPPNAAFLPKPFTLKALLRKVREVLEPGHGVRASAGDSTC